MAEKVTELSWVAFAKKALTAEQRKSVEDAGLLKALVALDKTDERKPGDRLKALETVVEQIPKLVVACGRRKKELGKAFDEVKDKLHGLLESAEAQQKAMQKALEAEKNQSSDDDEESPALLTSKMIPLLREVRKGELVLQALLALAGKETVVLLSRRAISPSRGKLLKEQMSNPGGLKFVRGECLWENNTLTFVVQAPAAALAKRIRAALLTQTAMRLGVKVRGEDGVEELDGEDETVEQASASAPSGDADPDAAFKARLTALIPRLKEAETAGHSRAQEARLKASEAGVFARKKEFELANGKLDEAEKLLGAPKKPTDTPKASGEALLAWQEARTTSIEQLRRLSKAVASTRDPQAEAFIILVQAIIKNLTASPTELRSIAEVERYLQTDDIIAEVETPNPFGITINVRAPLLQALGILKGSLTA